MLLPTVGKNNISLTAATIEAYKKLARDLADKKIETIILVSPLGIIHDNCFTLNVEPIFNCNFEIFGDLSTKFEVAGDVELAHELKKALDTKYSLQLSSINPLDYGSGVPMFFIKQTLPKVKIVPIYPANDQLTNLFAFGQSLKHEIEISSKKIAVIASGSLSQCLSKLSPAGYSPKARAWDKKIIKAIEQKQNRLILEQDESIRQEVKEAGLNSLSALLGCFDNIDHQTKLLSYEYPFGVGLLVFEFLV